jgi:hypothetical protein
MWLLTLFRKPLRAGSRKPLNLYGGNVAGQVFQKQMFLNRPDADIQTEILRNARTLLREGE